MYDMSVGTYTLILDTLVGVIVVRKLGAIDGMSLGICEITEIGSLNNTNRVLLVNLDGGKYMLIYVLQMCSNLV